MTIEQEVVTQITSDPIVTALLPASNLHPVKGIQGAATPYLVYARVSGSRDQLLSGDSDLDNARIQLTPWAKTYDGVKAISDAVRRSIKTSNLGFTINETDLYDPETRLYGVALDFSMWTNEV